MSFSEKERGSISVPKKEWGKMKKAMIEANNRVRQEMIEKATKIQGEIVAHFKGKRNVSYNDAIFYLESKYDDDEAYYMVADSFTMKGCKMSKITQAIADKTIKKANTKTTVFSTQTFDFELSIDNPKCRVFWDVPYLSRSIERSRNNALGSALLKILFKVDFGKKHGGCFYGNNESNFYDGDGQEYITARLGAGEDAIH